MDKYYQFVETNKKRYMEELFCFLRQKSISATGEGMEQTVKLLRDYMEEAGIKTRLLATEGYPAVYGEVISSPVLPTVLTVSYTHLDVYKRQIQGSQMGLGERMTSILPSKVVGSIDAGYTYDPEKAKEYLEKSGYVQPEGEVFTIATMGDLNADMAVVMPVSYTHLDVYKRQLRERGPRLSPLLRPPRIIIKKGR